MKTIPISIKAAKRLYPDASASKVQTAARRLLFSLCGRRTAAHSYGIPSCRRPAGTALILMLLASTAFRPAVVLAQPAGAGEETVDVAGGIFSDQPPEDAAPAGGSEVELPSVPEAGIDPRSGPMLPDKNQRDPRNYPLSAKEFQAVYDNLGSTAEQDRNNAADIFAGQEEKPDLPPQKEVSTRVMEIVKGKLDPFQKTQLDLIERAQNAPKIDNSAAKKRIDPQMDKLKKKMDAAKGSVVKQVDALSKKNQKEYEERKKEKEKEQEGPGVEVAAFGFDGQPAGGAGTGPGAQPPPISKLQKKNESKKQFTGSIENNGTNSAAAATVSLYINADPISSVQRSIEELDRLNKERRVAIGNVVLVGMADKRAQEAIKKMSSGDTREKMAVPNRSRQQPDSEKRKTGLPMKISFESHLLTKYKLHEIGFVKVQPLLKRLKVEISPVWVVRTGGKDYVIEGRDSIWSMISAEGIFVGPDPLAAQNLSTAKPKKSSYHSPTTLEDDPTPMVHYAAPGTGAAFRPSHYSEIRFGR